MNWVCLLDVDLLAPYDPDCPPVFKLIGGNVDDKAGLLRYEISPAAISIVGRYNPDEARRMGMMKPVCKHICDLKNIGFDEIALLESRGVKVIWLNHEAGKRLV